MSNRYIIRYGKTTTAISNYSDLIYILNGPAKGQKVEVKHNSEMPLVLHTAIVAHNGTIEKRTSK